MIWQKSVLLLSSPSRHTHWCASLSQLDIAGSCSHSLLSGSTLSVCVQQEQSVRPRGPFSPHKHTMRVGKTLSVGGLIVFGTITSLFAKIGEWSRVCHRCCRCSRVVYCCPRANFPQAPAYTCCTHSRPSSCTRHLTLASPPSSVSIPPPLPPKKTPTHTQCMSSREWA